MGGVQHGIIRDLRARIAELEADVEYAAGECLVPVPEPGTDMARILIANRLLSNRLEEAKDAKERAFSRAEESELRAEKLRCRVFNLEAERDMARKQERDGVIDALRAKLAEMEKERSCLCAEVVRDRETHNRWMDVMEEEKSALRAKLDEIAKTVIVSDRACVERDQMIADLRAKLAEVEISNKNNYALLCQARERIADLEAKLADAESLIDYAEIGIDEAVEDGWVPPSCKGDGE